MQTHETLFKQLAQIHTRKTNAGARCQEAFEMLGLALRHGPKTCPPGFKSELLEWVDQFYHSAFAELRDPSEAEQAEG